MEYTSEAENVYIIRSVARLDLWPCADRGRLRFCESLEAVCAAADFIQESVPERIDLKTRLHARMDATARPEVIIAYSAPIRPRIPR